MSSSWIQWSLSYAPIWAQTFARNVRILTFPSARKELYDGMYDAFYGNAYAWSVDPYLKATPVGEYARDLIGAKEQETLPSIRANFVILSERTEKMTQLLRDFFRDGGDVELFNDSVRTWYAIDANAIFIASSNGPHEAEVYKRLISRRAEKMQALGKTIEDEYDPAAEARKEHSVEYEIQKKAVVLDIVEEADEEGLMRREVLFGEGGRGSHEQVKEEMIRFTRERRARWEDGLEEMNEEQRRLTFKEYLRDESEHWREELRTVRRQWDEQAGLKG